MNSKFSTKTFTAFTTMFRQTTALIVAVILVSSFSRTIAAPRSSGGKAHTVAIPVRFKAEGQGFVSLALFDEQDVLARSLAYALPVTAGEHELIRDGTTDLGLPAAPGQFKVKGVFFTEAPGARFVMKVGKSGNPPWRTPDGKGDWGANLGGPCAISANSNSLMMAWSCVEDGQITGIQQTDTDGNIKMRYFSFYPWDGRSAGAMDETHFYLGILNGDKKRVEIAEYKLGEPRGRILTPLPRQTKPDAQGRMGITLAGMAITKNTIYATVGGDDNSLFVVEGFWQVKATEKNRTPFSPRLRRFILTRLLPSPVCNSDTSMPKTIGRKSTTQNQTTWCKWRYRSPASGFRTQPARRSVSTHRLESRTRPAIIESVPATGPDVPKPLWSIVRAALSCCQILGGR